MRSLSRALLATSAVAGLASAAFAQTPAPAPAGQGPLTNSSQASSPTPTPAGPTAAPLGVVGAPAPAAPPLASEIVVTGSRVIKNGSASPTPLTTISSTALQIASPVGTISDDLNLLPTFSGSRSSTSNPGAGASAVQGGNGSANVLNLRNLGAYRTLVLYDGHRIPPTLFNSTVDVDLIPQELVDRVDVVTGGVSAVYGSDAVSGVVNFVANRTFEGFRGHAEYGESQEGDDTTWDIGGAFGTKLFDDRGHFEISLQHRDSAGVQNRSSRDWDDLPAAQGLGTAADPYHLVTNVHLSGYTFGGLITSSVLKGQQFGSNGVLSPFVNGAATGSSCCQAGGSGAYQDSSLVAGTLSNQIFTRFDYDINSDVHAFVTAGIDRKTNISYPGWNTFQNYTFSATNAFLPAAYQAQLAAAGQKSFNLSEVLQGAPRQEDDVDTHQYYLNAGLEGRFFGDYHWDATYTHGDSYLDTRVDNSFNNQNLAAALDAVTNPATGQTVCRASLTNATYGNCSPLDVFGPTAGSANSLNYVLQTAYLKTHTGFDAVDGSVHGSPFSTWAGPVGLALSGEWRKQTLSATTNAPSTLLANCAGLTYNCSATAPPTLFQTTFPNLSEVSQSVEEGAIEGEVPLLKDVFLARSIDLNLAARYTNYSTSGSYTTWKAGLVWEVTRDFKLRATDSHDIRAPTLYDLFQPTVVVSGNFTDVKTNTTAFLPSINNGNPDLKAEQGYTFTAGGVYQPHWLPGAALTIDTYHTIIRHAITIVQGQNASIQAACNGSDGTSPYCALITRNAAGAVTAYYDEPENLSKIWTYGVDVEADYSRRILDRRFNARVFLTYQPHIYYEQPGVATVDQGDAGWGTNGLEPSPSTQLAAFFDYQVTPKLNVNLFEHYRNGFHFSGVQNQIWAGDVVPSFASTNIGLAYDLGDALRVKDSSLYFSVTNLFDNHPPLTGYYSGTTSAGQAYEFADDPVGRAFVVGIRIRH